MEAAIKLVKIARERRTILAFHGAYHGMTHGTLGLTGHLAPKQALSGLMPDVHFLPFPYEYRCPFGVGGRRAVACPPPTSNGCSMIRTAAWWNRLP